MKGRVHIFTVMLLVLCLLLSACGEGKGEGETRQGSYSPDNFETPDTATALESARKSLNEDGSYTVAEGDLYIGIRYEFEDEAYWELMTVCKGNAVTDCARNSPLERFTYKEEYVGKTYEEAFEDFYFLNQPAEDHGLPVKITLILMEDDNRKKYEGVLKSIRETIAPSAETDVQEDDRRHFDETITEFTVDLVQRLEEEESRKAREAEDAAREEERIRLEEEMRLAEEEKRREEEERLHSPVSDLAEIKERKALGINDFTLSKDVVFNVDEGFPTEVRIDCDGHSVTIKGCLVQGLKDSDRGMEFWNASFVDLSGFTIDGAAFPDEEYFPEEGDNEGRQRCISVIGIFETDYHNVAFPAGIPNRDDFDDRNKSVFEGYFVCEVNDAGDQESLTYFGPRTTYEARREQDAAVVTAILTNGDAYDILGEDYHGEYAVWTEVEIDLGNITLPNQDYMGIELKPGASLKVSGKIAVTGGMLDFTVCEAAQLDLTGLTLVKKHPSPDMVKVRYNASAGLNTSLLQAKAASGTIKFALGDEVYAITIW